MRRSSPKRCSRRRSRRRVSAIRPRSRRSTSRSTGAPRGWSTGARARPRWWPTPCATCSAAPISPTPTRSRAALDPKINRYRLENLNVSTHSPVMRALAHAHFVFRKKLSHTADSQDQRHRTVPGSRPLLSRTVPGAPDVVEPELSATTRPATRCSKTRSPRSGRRARALLELGASPEHRALRAAERARGALRGVGHAARPAAQVDDAQLPQRAVGDLARVDGRDRAGARGAPDAHGARRVRPAWCATGSRGRAAPRARTSAASRCGAASPRSSGASERRLDTATRNAAATSPP